MKTFTHSSNILSAVIVASLLGACTTGPARPEGADNVRSKLTALQSDPQLANRAPIAIKEAEQAVRIAEKPEKDDEYARHLVTVADRKVDIASHQAQARLLEDQRDALGQQADTARLDSRTREADRARDDADAARLEADDARRETEGLQREIDELNAKETDRGLVVTLGDLLFETGKADLRAGTANNLEKLAAFLTRYEDRQVSIEGHTDNVGSDDSNFRLSERRADAVRSYLLDQGIPSSRISVLGNGEDTPVAANDSASGRQMNRRVEVIITNMTSSMR